MHNSSLFNDPMTADFKVHCQNETIHVHKLIVTTRSDYFKTLCNSPFKESQNGEVFIDDVPPPLLRVILRAMYSGDYDMLEDQLVEQVLKHESAMLNLAKRFFVPGLDVVCVSHLESLDTQKISKTKEVGWSSQSILAIIEALQDSELRKRVITHFIDLMPHIMTHCSEADLKDCPELLYQAMSKIMPSERKSLHLKCPRTYCGGEIWYTLNDGTEMWGWTRKHVVRCPGCANSWKISNELDKTNRRHF